jgi:AcrR family transcriptional regulator
MPTGLRERRKQETRRALSDAAMGLFAARGFESVTISQVADAAGVSKKTVTNYFSRKEDLVFDHAEATIRGLADAVARRAPGESLLAAVRRDHAERIAAGDVTLGPPTATFARLIRDSTVLASRLREIAGLREQALGDALAAETGTDDPQQRIVAAQLASVHRVLFTEAARRILAGEAHDAIRQSLAAAAERAFDLLEPSLGGYEVRLPHGRPTPVVERVPAPSTAR